ncbi:MAG: hypothetical protein ACE5GW_00765 [Planctomycetota bacterium]
MRANAAPWWRVLRAPLHAVLAPVAFAFLLALPEILPAAAADDTVSGLVIRQEANGIPGRRSDELAQQFVFVTRDRLRLEDPQTGVVIIFRLDLAPQQIWEVSADGKEYRDGKHLGSIQRDRDRYERELLQRLAHASADERRAALEAAHLQVNGDRDVSHEVLDEAQKPLGHGVRRHRILENGRLIVDALVTEELGISIPFFPFYRQVGAFSSEVLDKLRGLPGVPLEASITVVTATINHKLHARALEVTPKELPLSIFELPEGCKKVEESPFANCPICGTQVEKKAPPAGKGRNRDGTWVFFDRTECVREWKRMRYGRARAKDQGERSGDGKHDSEDGGG